MISNINVHFLGGFSIIIKAIKKIHLLIDPIRQSDVNMTLSGRDTGDCARARLDIDQSQNRVFLFTFSDTHAGFWRIMKDVIERSKSVI